MIGWTIGGRVQKKSSARKVTHPSTIPGLDLEVQMGPGFKALGVSHSSGKHMEQSQTKDRYINYRK